MLTLRISSYEEPYRGLFRHGRAPSWRVAGVDQLRGPANRLDGAARPKRWDSTVGRPEIQKFAGALQGHRARKGVFITTSAFSGDALEFASRIDSKIVLIDGSALAKHMIDYNVGVSTSGSYEVKKIDSDYFGEE